MFVKKCTLFLGIFVVLMALLAPATNSARAATAAQGASQPVPPEVQGLVTRCLNNNLASSASDPRTGKINFIGTGPGKSIPQLTAFSDSVTPEQAARQYLADCGSLFGITDQAVELTLEREKMADSQRSVERFQQVYQGIPILAAELNVQLDASKNIISVNGDFLPDVKVDTQASVDAKTAQQEALRVVAEEYGSSSADLKVSEAELWIYNPMLIQAAGEASTLVWRMEVRPVELGPIRELVLVDAHSGKVVLNFNQVDAAKNRVTSNLNHATTTGSGTLVCNESNPTCSGGDTDAVNAHVYAGDTYDFYYSYHGRDSIDNAGMTLYSYTHYDTGYCNAFWDGYEMIYGDGCFLVVDDVVGHELTHGVTQYESGLVYSNESGAINESFSDVWGEFVDLTNGKGTDTPAVRWLMGEDTSIGAIRNMKDPTQFSNPDKMSSTYYYHGTDDNGGVHTNSGVNNKAAYLMTDGDTFNGYTVTGLGITKVAKIYYEAQTNLLTSGTTYYDLYNDLYQACTNLVGTSGITSADCQQVRNATLATEMNSNAPGQPPSNDDFGSPKIITTTPYTDTESTTLATTPADDPTFACVSGQKNKSVWYSYTPTGNATVTSDTFGSNYDTVLGVWTGSRGSLSSVACNDDDSGSGSLQSMVTFPASAGVTYYIEAASYGTGGGSLTLNVTSTSPPDVFSKISPANAATGVATSPTLSWASSSGATSYDYCYAITSGCTSWTSAGTNTSVALSGLSNNQIYYWQVRAVNTNGNTLANSGTYWSFTTVAPLPPPGSFTKSAPTNAATGQSTNPILSWGSSSNAASYEYCIDTSNDNTCNGTGTWTTTALNTNVGLIGLNPTTTYYWQVRANNASATTYADGGAWWSFTTGASVPLHRIFLPIVIKPFPAPTSFNKSGPANGATGQPVNPTLSWGTSSTATSYDYCYDTTNNNACDGSWITNGASTSIPLSGLTLSTTYYWQVRADNAGGSTYADGGTWWFFRTADPLPAPGSFNKSAPTNGATGQSVSPTLSWGASSNAASYDYCYATTTGCTSWTSAGTNTSVALSGLLHNQIYYWQVRAVNASGTTLADSSTYWSFTTVVAPSGPTAGLWQNSNASLWFYVIPSQTAVRNFAVRINVTGCGIYTITHTVDASISSNAFSFSGSFYASGTFDSVTTAHGTFGFSSFSIPGCGTITGSGSWTANWINSTQPVFVVPPVIQGPALQSPDYYFTISKDQ